MNPNEMTYERKQIITVEDIYGSIHKIFDYPGWKCVGFRPPVNGDYYKVQNTAWDKDPPEHYRGTSFGSEQPRLIYVRDYSDSDIVEFFIQKAHAFALGDSLYRMMGWDRTKKPPVEATSISRETIKNFMHKEGWKRGE